MTYTACQGYFVRKQKWLEIVNNDNTQRIINLFKAKMINEYNELVTIIDRDYLKPQIEFFRQRADFDSI